MSVIRRASTAGRGAPISFGLSLGSAGATSSLRASVFMSAMLTYLTPIVRAGKPILASRLRPATLYTGVHCGGARRARAGCGRQGLPTTTRTRRLRRKNGMVDTAPYDDRDGFIWFDGKLVPWREANVHLLTH